MVLDVLYGNAFTTERHDNGEEVFVNPDFPDHSQGIPPNSYALIQYGFRAGLYGTYNGWRDRLAKMAGYDSARDVWDALAAGPFYELINFSDCEGTIGPIVSEKLYGDFCDYDPIASATMDRFDYSMYCDFKEAFRVASQGGCVVFC